MVKSHRIIESTGVVSEESRYYLSSLPPEAEALQKLVRQHWSIENQCHWVLDVTFNEDQSRVRKGHAAANLSMLRKVALALLKQDQTVKDSVRGKRLRATLDEKTLEKFLCLPNSK